MVDKSLIEKEIRKLTEDERIIKIKLADLRRNLPRESIGDYSFPNHDGSTTKLSGLFGNHNELLVIHNMGKSCPYCTMWADGFNGMVNHLENRAGFVVISPDAPEIQKEFASSRNWKFQMLSGQGTTFIEDMGFKTGEGGYMPGVSAFIKDKSGNIFRVNKDSFGPGDNYCGTWHLFDLMPEGSNNWQPKFSY